MCVVMSQQNFDGMLLNTYNHYQQGGWDIWERKDDTANLPITQSNVSLNAGVLYKLAYFYIRDLHMSVQTDKHFVLKNVPFLYVHINGIIISQYIHGEKFCLQVSDGTGTIICLLEKDMMNNIQQEKMNFNKTSKAINKENNIFIEASLMNLGATRYLLQDVPNNEELCVGHSVDLYGKFTEHNEKKYVFVIKISKSSVNSFINYLQNLLSIYTSYDTN